MANYTLETCKNLIEKYANQHGGEITTVREGVLGLGTVVLHRAEGKKTYVINEVYVNAWVSAYTVRSYNKIPKKYEKLIEKVEESV